MGLYNEFIKKIFTKCDILGGCDGSDIKIDVQVLKWESFLDKIVKNYFTNTSWALFSTWLLLNTIFNLQILHNKRCFELLPFLCIVSVQCIDSTGLC